jgi:hypothetical protein
MVYPSKSSRGFRYKHSKFLQFGTGTTKQDGTFSLINKSSIFMEKHSDQCSCRKTQEKKWACPTINPKQLEKIIPL